MTLVVMSNIGKEHDCDEVGKVDAGVDEVVGEVAVVGSVSGGCVGQLCAFLSRSSCWLNVSIVRASRNPQLVKGARHSSACWM